jgi:hypothetical protein
LKERRVPGHLIKALPFFKDKKKLLKASESFREDYATTRFGGVFMKLLWRVRSHRLGRSLLLKSSAEESMKKNHGRSTPSKRTLHHELIGACVVGSLSVVQKIVEQTSVEIVGEPDSMGRTNELIRKENITPFS